MKKFNNILLLLGVICLTLMPLVLSPNTAFTGSDDQGEAQIRELAPDYKPWAESLLSLDDKTEKVLFGVQGTLGVLGVGYCLTEMKRRQGLKSNAD